MSLVARIERLIREVPDFPKPGILFKDITPVLADAEAFGGLIRAWADRYADAGISQVVGVESRGFILGAPLANALGAGFTIVRKPGKLPCATHAESFALEYGEDTLHMHQDALTEHDRVLIVDDVLATGGTAAATTRLVASTGATVYEFVFLMELAFLNGRSQLESTQVYSMLTFH